MLDDYDEASLYFSQILNTERTFQIKLLQVIAVWPFSPQDKPGYLAILYSKKVSIYEVLVDGNFRLFFSQIFNDVERSDVSIQLFLDTFSGVFLGPLLPTVSASNARGAIFAYIVIGCADGYLITISVPNEGTLDPGAFV